LLNGVLKAMLLNKLATGTLVAVVFLGLSAASITSYELVVGQNEPGYPGMADASSGTAAPFTLTWKERLAITPPAKANDPFHSAAISPDGQVLASGQASGVKLWDAVTGKE